MGIAPETIYGDLCRKQAEIEHLRALLDRVLKANIAQGCAPGHPRVQLIYDINEALSE